MRHKVEQAGITLQVVTQVYLVVDDALQVINRSFIITTSKIKRGNLIVEYENAVFVQKETKLLKFIFDIRHQCQAFFKSSQHKMLVDLGGI